MWIVVVVDHYYPSVFHFENEQDAMESYNKQTDTGHAVHIAKVINSKYDKDVYEFDENKIEMLDVEWYTSRD